MYFSEATFRFNLKESQVLTVSNGTTQRALGGLELATRTMPLLPALVRSDASSSRAALTSFRFRHLTQFCHGLRGSERTVSQVSAGARAAHPATRQVFGAFAHLQRARELTAYCVAAGEELLREVARPAALLEE